MRITAETLDHVTATLDRVVAVADFAKHGAITDEQAAQAGFYTDEGLGSPETLLYGPDPEFQHGCDVAGAWQAHTELCSGEVEYHVGAGNDGTMTMVMRIPAADPDAAPIELTIGMNERIGCYGMTPCQHSCVRQHLCPLERRAPSAISPRVGRRNDERSKGASTTSHAAIR